MKKEEEEENKDNEKRSEMSFIEHLDDLRKRIIYSMIGIIVCCIIASIFINQIMDYGLLLPAKKAGLSLQNLEPFGQPFLYFKMICLAGIIVSIPFVLYQLWIFIAPALYEHERSWIKKITFWTSICFFSGVLFSFFILIPVMFAFSSSIGSPAIKNNFDINKYFSFLSMMLLASGLVFEMPMLAFVLTRFGILNSKFLRKYWRHSMIVILILAAVLTPTTDPISMMIFASPLIFLYEISIWVSKLTERKKAKTA